MLCNYLVSANGEAVPHLGTCTLYFPCPAACNSNPTKLEYIDFEMYDTACDALAAL